MPATNHNTIGIRQRSDRAASNRCAKIRRTRYSKIMTWLLYAGVALLAYKLLATDDKPAGKPSAGDGSPNKKRVRENERKQAAALLGVDEDADEQTIRRAYQKKVREYHPDLVANAAAEIRELAEERTKALNAAYDCLKRG